MLYEAYQAHSDLMAPTRTFAELGIRALEGVRWAPPYDLFARNLSASLALIAHTRLTHDRPPFGIDMVEVDGREVAVHEEVAVATPFGDLVHFAKPDVPTPQPRVLLVAPLAGHFGTLVRETVRTLSRDHDVHLTNWHNARDVPASEGRFGFDEYTDHLIRFLDHLGPGTHVIAVCQPCVEALVATAVLAARGAPTTPRSLTLMAGPIDTRVNPTTVNDVATSHPIEWFERRLITTVPARYPGAGRRVYPGFLQLTAFMSMDPGRHLGSHRQLYLDLLAGRVERAAAVRSFYDEYFAVLDLTAEFYLETVERVFQQHQLPRGLLTHHGEPVELTAIRRTALLTVEGERDDICAPGQTLAAHDLCTGIAPSRQRHHLQPGVGHYGVFSGRRWDTQIYPVVRAHIRAS